MFCRTFAMALAGIEAAMICAETDVGSGLPGFELVGLLAGEAREAKERIRVAIKNSGFSLPPKKITVNLSPADMKKDGTAYDLAIAAGILCGLGELPEPALSTVCLLGELSLDGSINPVRGVLTSVLEAKRRGFRTVLVPFANRKEGAAVEAEGFSVYGIRSLAEAVRFLRGTNRPATVCERSATWEGPAAEQFPDFCEVRGQYLGKRAAQIAAAGFHNLLLIGPPGAGKTMLAKRIPGILPSLTKEEVLELTGIYSAAGLLSEEAPLLTKRPFRSPHHTVSTAAMVGGGRIPRPGEITLATHGVLFLDEFAEFSRASIEALRQPLEEGTIQISRAHASYRYPAKFMLVAATNPCPCGFFPNRAKCSCTKEQIARYLGKLSRPILDRIDLCAELAPVRFEELEGRVQTERPSQLPAKTSACMKKQVEQARKRQRERYLGSGISCNSEMRGDDLLKYCSLGRREQEFLKEAFERFSLSARGYHRLLKVARTIADLDESEAIGEAQLQEALCFRPPEYREKESESYG